MSSNTVISSSRDKFLFTPGPLTTSLSVKQAMLHDQGSWDLEFKQMVAGIRDRLLRLAGISREGGWDVVPLQGSGSFGVEAVFQTCIPPDGKAVVMANGAYGERIVKMLSHARIAHTVLRTPEDVAADPTALDDCLSADSSITHVAVVHCETTTGILNPIQEIGAVARRYGKVYVVDAMSGFAGVPIDFEACGFHFLVSSANKCIEGVPGFSFIFFRRENLLACEGWARSLSLDILDQFKVMEKEAKFRYTPPTHAILAFEQAMTEIEAEGGVPGRNARYRRNHEVLQSGMRRLGFKPFLDSAVQSPIITAYYYPESSAFEFNTFYEKLSDRGFIIYAGKLSQANTFRIGNIGRVFPSDMEQLVCAVEVVMREMGAL